MAVGTTAATYCFRMTLILSEPKKSAPTLAGRLSYPRDSGWELELEGIRQLPALAFFYAIGRGHSVGLGVERNEFVITECIVNVELDPPVDGLAQPPLVADPKVERGFPRSEDRGIEIQLHNAVFVGLRLVIDYVL